MVSRRRALQLAGLSALGGLGLSRLARADEPSDRKFLFLLAYGGWDPSYVFASTADHPDLAQPAQSERVQSGDLSWVRSDNRPSVDAFFDRYGAQTCILNGLVVPSVTHEQCRKLVLTGARDGAVDDWGAILGGQSTGFDLPTVVVSGPAYASRYASTQLRMGPAGQLAELADGTALQRMTPPPTRLSAHAEDAVQAYLAERYAAYQAPAGGEAVALGLDQATRQLDQLQNLEGVDLRVHSHGFVYASQRVEPALELLQRGLTRCAAAVHLGEWDANWDTHADIERQAAHYDFFFDDVLAVLESMEDRGLLETTTVVLLSEMGRSPVINKTGGKDHWTYTSAALLGAGVRGGQVVGGFDADWFGVPVDGRVPTTADLGATLLTLGGVDPESEGLSGSPLEPVLA